MCTSGRNVVAVTLLVIFAAGAAVGEEAQCGVFLSKSAGFEHSCIRWDEEKISHVDRVLQGLADDMGIEILCTKDASVITADNLKNYNIVVFFTTGDLTATTGDGQPAMAPTGTDDLLAWIRAGGGFMGFHCASDTFHTPAGGPVTPFLQMVGGEFRAHGAQFEGTLRVVDPGHPTMAHLPAEWLIKDEWYLFKNFNRDSIHVLALLDPGDEREKQEKYQVPAYPIAWCSTYGKGRVFYNAMGHREDVWDNPTFQQHVVDAAKWAMGEGADLAAPNFREVMSDEDAQIAEGESPAPAK